MVCEWLVEIGWLLILDDWLLVGVLFVVTIVPDPVIIFACMGEIVVTVDDDDCKTDWLLILLFTVGRSLIDIVWSGITVIPPVPETTTEIISLKRKIRNTKFRIKVWLLSLKIYL